MKVYDQYGRLLTLSGSYNIDAFLDDTAGGTDALLTKAPTSNVFYDHTQAADPHTGYVKESVLETTVAATDSTTQVPSSRLVFGMSRKNAIINGAMDIWQRGTSFTNPALFAYLADRFCTVHVLGDGTFNVLQAAETPVVGFPFQYSLQVDCTHIETAVAADEISEIRYNMEGYDAKRFIGETATLSFWVKATKTGIYCVNFQNSAQDRTYIAEYTVNSSNTWEKKTITLTFNATGTWLTTTGVGLRISWVVLSGSTYQSTANSWLSANVACTSNQVNGFDSTDNNFYLTGVQLELGSVATPFEFRHFEQELALCQRYYEKSFDQAEAPVTNIGTGHGDLLLPVAILGADSYAGAVYYKVTKRLEPNITLYNRGNASNDWTWWTAAGASVNGGAATAQSEIGFWIILTGDATRTLTTGHWVAEKEL